MKVSVAVVLYVMPHGVCVGNTISMDADSVNNCWVSAGKRYSVDPWLLYTISSVESGMNPLAVNVNKDESRDLGLMQINSWWLPQLSKFGITEESLFDACTNINVGAWILAQNIGQFGHSWDAVGAYNAGTGKSLERTELRASYAHKIYRRYIRLAADQRLRITAKQK